MSNNVCEKWIIHGRVQRVGYRYFSARHARSFCLEGGTRNLHDGSVEVIIFGDLDSVERFYSVLRKGPSHADVTSITREAFLMKNFVEDQYDLIYSEFTGGKNDSD